MRRIRDFSNYWTAVMYFKRKDGMYKRVPQYANAQLEGATKGMTIYYTQLDFNGNGNEKITAFKPVSCVSHMFGYMRLTIGRDSV
jgi:hypothetical protein